MARPTASILLLTKNAGSRFETVLERIESQTSDWNIEIVVVDSGSTDGTVDIARKHADVFEQIPPETFHHSRTRNLAADHASGDVYVYLTQDAIPLDESWLDTLIEPLEDSAVGAVYGRQQAYPDAKPMDEFFYSYFYPEDPKRLEPGAVKDERRFYLENVYVSDVCSAIPAAVFDEVRFREDVSMSEDKDFALRALDAGYEIVYEPDAVVRHSHDYSIPEVFLRRFKDGKAYGNIASGSSDTFFRNGLEYVIAEMNYLIQSGSVSWIPYAVLYDIAYMFGFTSGEVIANFSSKKQHK